MKYPTSGGQVCLPTIPKSYLTITALVFMLVIVLLIFGLEPFSITIVLSAATTMASRLARRLRDR